MKSRKIGGPPPGEGFCWYTREMLLHPAFSEQSINCRRFIAALEFENMSHAGTENGNLVKTQPDGDVSGSRKIEHGGSVTLRHVRPFCDG